MICAPLLMGGACEKKTTQPADTGAVSALDRTQTGPVDTTPLPGIAVTGLSDDKQQQFYKLVGSLQSPCGKTHSLRTSFASDTDCKRAPFAVRYVLALLDDEASEAQVRDEYKAKYEAKVKPVKFDVADAPRAGNDDAPVQLVEFFDYACSHCAELKKVMDEVAAAHPADVAVYYFMFPLGKWPDSKSAAQAALAAARQGKFPEMHALLFRKSPIHNRDAVMGYARELGLDLPKFEQDYAAVAAQVEQQRAQGEAAGVEGTPAVFFNDRLYEGPLTAKYIGLWIAEEVAVNR